MAHGQFVVGDVFTRGLLQIGDQVGQEQILQLAAFLADQMAVGHGIAVIAVGLSGDGQPADLPISSQLIEIAVNRTHGDVGHLLPGPEKHFLSGQVVADIGQNIADQCLLFGHLITSFQYRELFLVLIYHTFSKCQEKINNNS